MSSQGFSFPPPPPPPPVSKTSFSLDQPSSYGGAPYGAGERGRGRARSSHSSNLRSNYEQSRSGGSGGSLRGAHGHNQHYRPGYHSRYSQQRNGPRGGYGREFSGAQMRGQKRMHDQAFERQHCPAQTSSAPPSVPSYGSDLGNLVPQSAGQSVVQNTSSPGSTKTRKNNLFGLTPSMDEEKNEDEDEEARLAAKTQGVAVGTALQFEHRGQTMSLRTPEELAAWIAERRKRFPTRAKAEEAAAKAKIEAEERTGRRSGAAEEHRKKLEEIRSRQKSQRQQRELKSNRAHIPDSAANKAQAKADRLQGELERAQKRVARLQAQAEQAGKVPRTSPTESGSEPQGQASMMSIAAVDQNVSVNELMESCDDDEVVAFSEVDDDEPTSSSGSEEEASSVESDADAPPIEASSKRLEPERVTLPPRERPACRDFARRGRCPRGRKCYFKHEPREGGHKNVAKEKTDARRGTVQGKSLYQRLSEQQQEMTQELVLQHILFLGDNGYLDEPSSAAT